MIARWHASLSRQRYSYRRILEVPVTATSCSSLRFSVSDVKMGQQYLTELYSLRYDPTKNVTSAQKLTGASEKKRCMYRVT